MGKAKNVPLQEDVRLWSLEDRLFVKKEAESEGNRPLFMLRLRALGAGSQRSTAFAMRVCVLLYGDEDMC